MLLIRTVFRRLMIQNLDPILQRRSRQPTEWIHVQANSITYSDRLERYYGARLGPGGRISLERSSPYGELLSYYPSVGCTEISRREMNDKRNYAGQRRISSSRIRGCLVVSNTVHQRYIKIPNSRFLDFPFKRRTNLIIRDGII